jgi:hypothetical protein
MNKRIKKKQMRLKRFKVGDTIYDRKKVSEFNKLNMGLMNILSLYSKIKVPLPKWSQSRINGLMNYIYKNRMRLYPAYEYHGLVSSLDTASKPKTILPLNTPYSPIIRKDC